MTRSRPVKSNVRRSTLLVAAGGTVVAAVILLMWFRPPRTTGGSSSDGRTVAASYVGSTACGTCHTSQAGVWKASQHAAAMAEASEASVRGQFDGRQVTLQGVTSTFFRRDGKYVVRTDGADGRLADFEIAYTFGVEPLQQYLVRFPGGRLQALSLAWDTRPQAAGGQRWFHLYPNEAVPAGDALHWTGRHQNWNYMCADCHSTNLRKGYDESARTFATTWSEISVGCEACHGPGSIHVEQVKAGRSSEGYGLPARLDERRGVTWRFDAAARVPMRSQPKAANREVEVCARCHSRRAQLTDEWHAGQSFEDGFRPSALEGLLYYPDGQQRDEVYTHGSFLQSRMHEKGVTCSDCHDPHSGQLRQTGNGLCRQCHQDPVLDSPAHHLHKTGTSAAACVTCHMPTTTYMVIDPRHDHRFGVPRPDLTVTTGVPNACTTNCHRDRGAPWAAAEIEERLGPAEPGSLPHAEAFSRLERGLPGAATAVRAMTSDRAQPAIVRAGALTRLAGRGAVTPDSVEPSLTDPSPMVRRAAIDALRGADERDRLRLVTPLLSDPVRTVRIDAARTLADLADRALGGASASAFASAFREFTAGQRFNADRPEAQVELGVAWLARGRFDEAAAAFREALTLDPAFSPAAVNLADAMRLKGDEAEAERVLRTAMASRSTDAGLRHSLGLSLVRQKRLTEALVELREAARLDPSTARYGYVLGVALHDGGQREEALRTFAKVHETHPTDRDTLAALALFNQEAGRAAAARLYAQRLLALDPADAGAQELAIRLGATGSAEGKQP